MRKNKQRPHHELGVTFGQSISHKANGLQMLDHCMEEPGLEKKMKINKIK